MNARGFTLIEVVIAFAIVAMFSIAFYESTAVALKLHSKSGRLTRAALVADSAIAQVVRGDVLTERRGEIDGCAWTASAEQVELEGMPQGASLPVVPIRVTVQVRCDPSPTAPADIAVSRVTLLERS